MTPRQWAEVEAKRQQAERERHAEVVRAAIAAGERDCVIVSLGFGYNPTRVANTLPPPRKLRVRPDQCRQIWPIKSIPGSPPNGKLRKRLGSWPELEAEQACLAKEKAEAEAEAKRQSEIMIACQSAGVSPEQWQTMTPNSNDWHFIVLVLLVRYRLNLNLQNFPRPRSGAARFQGWYPCELNWC